MAGSPSYAHIKADVLAVIAAVPRGKVTTFTAVGSCLGVLPRHVATIVAGLDPAEGEAVPWHRVVADGGAIGRHARRDEQIRRLRADGLAVSPAGIVGGLEGAMLTRVTKPRAGWRPASRADAASLDGSGLDGSGPAGSAVAAPGAADQAAEPAAGPSKARGRFDRPATKLE